MNKEKRPRTLGDSSSSPALAADQAPLHPAPKNVLIDNGLRDAIERAAAAGDGAIVAELIARLVDPGQAAQAWWCISRVHATAARWTEARAALEEALRLQPSSTPMRWAYAVVLEQLGAAEEALSILEALAREHEDSTQLTVQLARTLHHLGRSDEAEAKLESALRRQPTDVQVHQLLARLRWVRGAQERATLRIEQAIAAHPGALQLRLVAADILRNGGYLERALELLREGLRLAPDAAGFLSSIGVVLEGMGKPDDALPYLRAAVLRAPHSAVFKRNLIPTLLRLADAAAGLSVIDELSVSEPNDQQLIAYRAIALRLMGDPRYAELHDYARLVRSYQPMPPAGFTSIGSFNTAFAAAIGRLHREGRRPLDQSLRGGTQTDGNLPVSDPVVAAFFSMLEAPIRDYIGRLRDASAHPTDRRKADGYRIAGSWSVQLQPGGFHVNHVHPIGWLSSAYYIELPETLGDDVSRAGWLKFGEPAWPVPGCAPDHFVQPTAGMLVLFPSYMWHGTVPFTRGGRRLTAAFDVVPN